jgi:hypothetical protein
MSIRRDHWEHIFEAQLGTTPSQLKHMTDEQFVEAIGLAASLGIPAPELPDPAEEELQQAIILSIQQTIDEAAWRTQEAAEKGKAPAHLAAPAAGRASAGAGHLSPPAGRPFESALKPSQLPSQRAPSPVHAPWKPPQEEMKPASSTQPAPNSASQPPAPKPGSSAQPPKPSSAA